MYPISNMKLLVFQNEIKETAVSLVVNNTQEGVFHSSNGAVAGHNLAAAQNSMEEPTYSQRNYSTPQVVNITSS